MQHRHELSQKLADFQIKLMFRKKLDDGSKNSEVETTGFVKLNKNQLIDNLTKKTGSSKEPYHIVLSKHKVKVESEEQNWHQLSEKYLDSDWALVIQDFTQNLECGSNSRSQAEFMNGLNIDGF